MVHHYTAILYRSADGYGVAFPDIPGCVSAGATVEEAVTNAAEALAGHIEVTLQHGETVPLPRPPEKIPTEDGEAARFLVPWRRSAEAA